MNGNDVRRASHQEAVTFLIAPVQDVYLTVRHDPSPPGLQVRHLIIITSSYYMYVSHVSHTVHRNSALSSLTDMPLGSTGVPLQATVCLYRLLCVFGVYRCAF